MTEPTSRRWLARPHPYIAGRRRAGDLSCPCWSGMPSTAGSRSCSRAGGPAVRCTRSGRYWRSPDKPRFLLPWIWAPLVWCGFVALRRGPSDRERWLLVCLAAPPILCSPWPRCGATPLSLGGAGLSDAGAAARRSDCPPPARPAGCRGSGSARRRRSSSSAWASSRARSASTGCPLSSRYCRSAGTRTSMSSIGPRCEPSSRAAASSTDPGWSSPRPKWHEAGKIDYALGGRVPVICLGPDPRQYGLDRKPR